MRRSRRLSLQHTQDDLSSPRTSSLKVKSGRKKISSPKMISARTNGNVERQTKQSCDLEQPTTNVLDILEESNAENDHKESIIATNTPAESEMDTLSKGQGENIEGSAKLPKGRKNVINSSSLTLSVTSSRKKAEKKRIGTVFLAPDCNVENVEVCKSPSENDLPLTSSQLSIITVESDSLESNSLQTLGEKSQISVLNLGKTSKYSNANNENINLRPNLLKLTSQIFQTLPFKLNFKDIEAKKKIAKKIIEKKENESHNLHELDIISLQDEKKTSVDKQEKKTNRPNANELSSELEPHIDKNDVYFKMDKLNFKPIEITKKGTSTKMLKKSVIGPDLEKMDSVPLVHESASYRRKVKKQKRGETAGPGWYNIPKTEVTPELKKDFQLMKMRNILDPHRHYKKSDKKFPQYFQIGTVVGGAAEFYSSRISKKQRKRTMVDKLLADAEFRKKNKRKYLEIQKVKQSGGKGYYKKMKNKRKPTWARS